MKLSLKKNEGRVITPKMKPWFLFTMAVRVTATTTHKTLFIIVIKNKIKFFFLFKSISDIKMTLIFSKFFLSERFFVQNFLNLSILTGKNPQIKLLGFGKM